MDPPGNIMHVNGKRAIGIGVSTDPTKDVVKTGELVDQKLAELLPLIPVGLELESLYPENVIAQEANNGFIINLIESLLIVIVIIMLVMGLRAGILIGSSLIFSHWRYAAHHVFHGSRIEPYFTGRFHHCHGYAGG